MAIEQLVSVIIPVFNAEEYLRETLNSVLRQTHREMEVILVNDGSTDRSEEIIHSFKDPRIRCLTQENKGQCAASNYGLSKARGAYIKFFDADDLMNETHIERQLQRIEGRKDVIASCEWGAFYDGDPVSAIFSPEEVWEDLRGIDWLKTSLQQKGDMMGACLWLIPRQLLEKTGGWDERLSLNNDFEFGIRLLLHAESVLFTPGAKVFYRLGKPKSLSQIRSAERFEAAILSTDLGCAHLLKAESSAEMKRICANRYQLWLHRIYPQFPDLTAYLEEKIATLGGSDRKLEGGRVFRMLNHLLGWKQATKLRFGLQRVGYRKLPFN